MHKKMITGLAVLLSLTLCACEFEIPVQEVEVTPVSFDELKESSPAKEVKSDVPEKIYSVSSSVSEDGYIYDETNMALLGLYEAQKEIEINKQAEAKEKKNDKKNGSSGKSGSGKSGSGKSGSGSSSQDNSGNSSQDNSGSSSQEADYYWEDDSSFTYTAPSVTGYADQVVALVNAERAAVGLGSLSATSSLNQAAQKRAEEIVATFDHTRPDGRSCFTVFNEYGISYGAAGENIAAGQWSPDSVMGSWMNSPGHKSNILGEKFNHIGVGVVYVEGSTYGYYWVQLFTD